MQASPVCVRGLVVIDEERICTQDRLWLPRHCRILEEGWFEGKEPSSVQPPSLMIPDGSFSFEKSVCLPWSVLPVAQKKSLMAYR